MKTISIHGNEYVPVNERIMEFHRLYPKGQITTQIEKITDDVVVFKAFVQTEPGEQGRIFTGHAYEVKGSNMINNTSHLEVCETSAIGRCLGMLGIGIDGGIASAEEVQNATSEQYSRAPKKQIRTVADMTLDQIKGHELDFGKYKGRTLISLLGDDRVTDYFEWYLGQEAKDERGSKIQAIIQRFMEEVVSDFEDESVA